MESNSSLRFVSDGCRISDLTPRLGSDGYVGHCKTPEEALAETAKRNLLWAAEVEQMTKEGREWIRTCTSANHFFWGIIQPKREYYID